MMDPTQQAGQAQQPGGAQALRAVCISTQPDGTFLVYPEDEGQEAGQPAQDAQSAADLAITMLTGGQSGASAPGAAPADGDGDDAEALFQGGFSQARGTPLGK